MSRTRALAATLTLMLAAPHAGEAQAWPFGKKEAKGAETAKSEAKPAKPQGEAAAAAPAGPRRASPVERAAASRLDPLAQAAFWAHEFQVDPADAEAGVRLAASLRTLGQHDEAAATAQQVLALKPNEIPALYEFARARIAAGQGFYAIEPLRQIRQLQPNDWKPLSLLGVAMEQAQRLTEARAAWNEALRLSPDNPQVLTNIALSHMAQGQGDQAEALLRRAAARPDADTRVRQNLALVLGLRGRMAEAESLLRQDLPPEAVAENLAWLRTRTGGGPRTWGALQNGG
jgi:Flp pilus assembly protein TadD